MSNQPTTDRLAEVLDCDQEAWEVYGPAIFHMDATGPECFAHYRIAATQSLSADLDKAQSQLVDAEQRLAMVEAENVRLRAVVLKYADDLCEHSIYNEGCGKFDELTCGGCFARAALNQPKESGND